VNHIDPSTWLDRPSQRHTSRYKAFRFVGYRRVLNCRELQHRNIHACGMWMW
ncbi:Hypothetical predicted protein, partial [Pelobates cultripes]